MLTNTKLLSMQHHFRGAILKAVLFPVVEKALKNDFWKKFHFLVSSQQWTQAERRQYQLGELRRIVTLAFDTVPFYSALYRRAGVAPDDLGSLEDIGKFPEVDKRLMREKSRTELVSSQAESVIENRTAGSTGAPFEFYMSNELLGWKYARYFYFMDKLGLVLGRRYFKFWGESTAGKVQDFFTRNILNRREINAFEFDDTTLQNVLEEIRRSTPAIVESYASSIYTLAQYVRKKGLETQIPVIVTSAETLPDYQKETVARTFQSDVRRRYGSREFGNIAQECKCGHMHVLETNFLVESVNGRLLVTCFDNHTMPFIRYDIGDIAEVEEVRCACGEKSMVIKDIEGRTSDVFITPRGKRIPPTFFYYAIDYHFGKQVKRFQVCFAKNGIEIRIIPGRGFCNALSNRIRKKVKGYLDETEVTVRLVDDIKLTRAGKYKAIINQDERYADNFSDLRSLP